MGKRIVFEDVVPPEDIFGRGGHADLSDVQELRVRLIRAGYAGQHESRICAQLEVWVASARPSLTEFRDRVRELFGPWEKPEKDEKGRTIWYRSELLALSPKLRADVATASDVVVRPDPPGFSKPLPYDDGAEHE